jgi:hypothetical protein
MLCITIEYIYTHKNTRAHAHEHRQDKDTDTDTNAYAYTCVCVCVFECVWTRDMSQSASVLAFKYMHAAGHVTHTTH